MESIHRSAITQSKKTAKENIHPSMWKLAEIKTNLADSTCLNEIHIPTLEIIASTAIEELPLTTLNEILTKLNTSDQRISHKDIIARAVAIHYSNKFTGVYNIEDNDHHIKGTGWQKYPDIVDDSGNKVTIPMAFSLSPRQVEAALSQLDDPGDENMLDCSVAKQLINLMALVCSQKLDTAGGKTIVVHNESVAIEENAMVKVQTVYNHLETVHYEETPRTTMDNKVEHKKQRKKAPDQINPNQNLKFDPATLIPGDSVYFENDPNYPEGPEHLFSGEHAIFTRTDENGIRFYKGFGLSELAETTMLDTLREEYLKALKTENGNKDLTAKDITTIAGFPKITAVHRFIRSSTENEHIYLKDYEIRSTSQQKSTKKKK